MSQEYDRDNQGVVSTLEACLNDKTNFCKLRAEVVLTMSATANYSSGYAAVPMLCKCVGCCGLRARLV